MSFYASTATFFFAPLWRMGPRCSSAETQVCHRSYIIAARKNVRVKLEKKSLFPAYFGTLLFYTLISSNTTLRCMFAQGRKDGWTNADHYYITPSLRGGGQKGYTGWIYTFIQTRNNRVQTYGWPTLGQTDLRTNEPSD